VNCETIALHKRLRHNRHQLKHSLNLLKVKLTLKSQAEHKAYLKGIADTIKGKGASFLKGFVL